MEGACNLHRAVSLGMNEAWHSTAGPFLSLALSGKKEADDPPPVGEEFKKGARRRKRERDAAGDFVVVKARPKKDRSWGGAARPPPKSVGAVGQRRAPACFVLCFPDLFGHVSVVLLRAPVTTRRSGGGKTHEVARTPAGRERGRVLDEVLPVLLGTCASVAEVLPGEEGLTFLRGETTTFGQRECNVVASFYRSARIPRQFQLGYCKECRYITGFACKGRE